MPAFSKPLSDINVQLSETVTLECTVTGLPLPQTQWFVSGIELHESDRYHIDQKDDTAILQILNVVIDDTEMEYTCKAINVVGEAVSTARLKPQGLCVFLCCLVVAVCLARMMCVLSIVPQHGYLDVVSG